MIRAAHSKEPLLRADAYREKWRLVAAERTHSQYGVTARNMAVVHSKMKAQIAIAAHLPSLIFDRAKMEISLHLLKNRRKSWLIAAAEC